MFSLRVSFVVLVCILASGGTRTATAQPEEAAAETWAVYTIAGTRVGHSRDWTERREAGGQKLRVSNTEEVLNVTRAGQKLQMRSTLQVEETEAGQLVGFSFLFTTPPSEPRRISGRVAGDKLLLQIEVAGRSQTVEKPWKTSDRGPNAEQRLLREKPLKPGESRTLRSFDLVKGEFTQVTQVAAAQRSEETLLDGTKKTLLKVRSQSTPELAVDSYVDDHGETWKESIALLGGINKFRVSKAEALKSITGAELDLLVEMLVKVPAIPKAHESRKAVYRITIAGEDPTKIIPAGPTQGLRKLEGSAVELTVTSIVPPPKAAANVKVEPQYLGSNRYLQADDPRVKELTRQAAGNETDPWKLAVTMEQWVSVNLKSKNFSTAFGSAAEVAKDLSGDCTEHAVLLAAMCRAKNVPSRIAVGLVYSDSHSAFVGHAWTEVFVNGTWVPLDATLGRGRVAAEHVKFSDSTLNGDGATFHEFLPLMTALGKMRIEVLSLE